MSDKHVTDFMRIMNEHGGEPVLAERLTYCQNLIIAGGDAIAGNTISAVRLPMIFEQMIEILRAVPDEIETEQIRIQRTPIDHDENQWCTVIVYSGYTETIQIDNRFLSEACHTFLNKSGLFISASNGFEPVRFRNLENYQMDALAESGWRADNTGPDWRPLPVRARLGEFEYSGALFEYAPPDDVWTVSAWGR